MDPPYYTSSVGSLQICDTPCLELNEQQLKTQTPSGLSQPIIVGACRRFIKGLEQGRIQILLVRNDGAWGGVPSEMRGTALSVVRESEAY